ncbi:PIN domain-containing protein [Ramlibacter sp. USB13]|uniref:Ribonuclease VapC n=1 Tax=Ramlibacter cellulosilyticus TaxID=2764187 RepID=A0A923MWS0_9BURK|nr:PIN domain-containing protein [Ramlibacter cellulosilyticus]
MVVVDSGVWIDFFNDRPGAGTDALDRLLQDGEVRLVVPDLVLYEVLRGFRHEREFRQARVLMESVGVESTGGAALALEAAQHYRSLRAAGVTVRSPVDVLIATFCIENGYVLLHRDRDFDAFEELRGLRAWRH